MARRYIVLRVLARYPAGTDESALLARATAVYRGGNPIDGFADSTAIVVSGPITEALGPVRGTRIDGLRIII